ncbi:hypothetical protein BH24CHL9_BH24CHL9_11120 [soil metagenome]
MKRMLPIGALTAALALTFSATAALAQDASPEPLEASPAAESPATEPGTEATTEPGTEPGTQDPQAEAPHPAHIHTGTCETLGDVVFPLSNVSSEMLVDGEPGAGDQAGAVTADPMRDEVQVSVTTVQAALTDIMGAEHAINVHLSDDEIQTYIACGTIAGSLILDSGLAIRLHELNDSGHHGIAWLAQADEGSTAVYIVRVQESGAAGGPGAMPDESPAASPMAGEECVMPDESPAAASPMTGEEGVMPDESPAASPTAGEEGAMPDESPAA